MNSTTATARSVLGVPESASAEEASCEFLRGLAGDDYVPSSVKVQALNVIGCIRLPWERDAVSELECVDEVAVFASEYWSLEPAVRRSRWESLRDRRLCEYRLRELERGLDVVVIQLDDADANELACVFRELFVLPRRERAIRRAQWMRDQAAQIDRWKTAFVCLRRINLGVFELDPLMCESMICDTFINVFCQAVCLNPELGGITFESLSEGQISTCDFTFQSSTLDSIIYGSLLDVQINQDAQDDVVDSQIGGNGAEYDAECSESHDDRPTVVLEYPRAADTDEVDKGNHYLMLEVYSSSLNTHSLTREEDRLPQSDRRRKVGPIIVVGLAMLLLVMMLIRGGLGSREVDVKSPIQVNHPIPSKVVFPQILETPIGYTELELREFFDYEDYNGYSPKSNPPTRYKEWVRDGRPVPKSVGRNHEK